MFKCQQCGKITEPREFMTKKTVAVREWIDSHGYKRKDIEKEVHICNECAGIKISE